MNDIINRKNPCDAAFKLMREHYMNNIQHSGRNMLSITFENELLLSKILLIQNTTKSLTGLIRFCFMSIIYDVMDSLSYDFHADRINNEYYKQFLIDLKDGNFLVHEDIYICLLAAHKRLNINLDEVIDIGKSYIRMNYANRGTMHANFIQLIGIEYIEGILMKIIENLYKSDDYFYEEQIIKKSTKNNDHHLKPKGNNGERKDITLNKEQYTRAKSYSGQYYYINSSIQSFYTDLIMQLNTPLNELFIQKKYIKFRSIILPDQIVFEDKLNDISKCTHIIYNPYTKTGRKSKYPICCHFYVDEKLKIHQSDFERELFGNIYLLEDNSIGKAKICIWRGHDLLIIEMKREKNSLVISKIEEK